MKKPLIILLCITVAVVNPITVQGQLPNFPSTEPLYISSRDVFSATRINESSDDKANLEPLPLDHLDGGLYDGQTLGFSTQGNVNYFLVESPHTSSFFNPAFEFSFRFYVYTANPESGTWFQVLLETTDGTIEVRLDAEVPSDPHDEIFDATYSNNGSVEFDMKSRAVHNKYAESRNIHNGTIIGTAYKNESSAIFVTNLIGNVNDSSTTSTDEFSWVLAKFETWICFSVRGLPSQAYANDAFIRVTSPLNLTFSYNLDFKTDASPGFAFSQANFANFPRPFFLLIFIPLAVFLFTKRMKKADR